MSKKVVISFEKDAVKVVYGTVRGNNLVITKTCSVAEDEFDGFLQREKAEEFIVVYDFKAFYSDRMELPPVKRRYFKGVVESKIRNKFPELKDFSYLHTMLGEKLQEGKKKTEVFVFAVDRGEIDGITDRFSRYGKRITHLIPSLFSLVQTVPLTEEPVLCVANSGPNKVLFLMEGGKILFIRLTQGVGSGIHDADVRDINMTINYHRQSLKINIAQVVLIGSACLKYDAKTEPLVPLSCLDYRPRVLASKQTILEFLSAIPCVHMERASKAFLRESNILPASYKSLSTTKTILSYSTILFVIFILSGLGWITFEIIRIGEVKKRIEMTREQITHAEPVSSTYAGKKTELLGLIPLIHFSNRMYSTPQLQKALLALPALDLKNIQIDQISMIPGAEAIQLGMRGVVEASGFSETHLHYQNLVDSMNKIDGMEVSSHRVEIKNKTFTIDAGYSP
jgi:hypothetical protein